MVELISWDGSTGVLGYGIYCLKGDWFQLIFIATLQSLETYVSGFKPEEFIA